MLVKPELITTDHDKVHNGCDMTFEYTLEEAITEESERHRY